jgi:D-beta-D-heptose 7-phosphate kinase/D-beta-D-heptose 1-phosphate adenosyltransferase
MAMTTAPKIPSKIVLEAADVVSFVKKWRSQGKKIVLTQGSFDLVHIGHARYCAKAKEYGDVLIVGVDSDAKVRQRKGDDRPVVPQEERLEMLTYLAAVDLVVLKELEAEKYSLIKAIRPEVLVATAETYTPEKIKKLEEFCGKVVVLEPMATTSTSAKIRRLQIGMVQKISDKLSTRLNNTIAEVLKELRGE